MSIYAVTGVPGSGKSYFSVYDIYEKLKSKEDFLILTNIEGLNCTDSRVITCTWSSGQWFRNSKQEIGIKKLREDYSLSDDVKIYYYIDEAQRFFPPELRDNDVVYFFDYHRHYGLEIYLITQNIWKISKKISTLVELEYRAVNNRINPLPRFTYKVLAGGEQFKTLTRKKEKSVFNLYTSFQAGSKDKKDKTLAISVCIGIVLFALGWYGFRQVFSDSLGARVQEEKRQALKKNGFEGREGKDFMDSLKDRAESKKIEFAESFDGPQKEQRVEYMGPSIKDFRMGKLIIEGDSGFDYSYTVKQFLKIYPPDIYGFSYITWDNKFVMFAKGTNEIIYPIKGRVYRSDVQRISYDNKHDGSDDVKEQSESESGSEYKPGSMGEDSEIEYKKRVRDIKNRFHQVLKLNS